MSLARWIETLSGRVRDRLSDIGLLDSRRAGASKPFSAHLEDWKRNLEAKGSTEKHVKLTMKRARTVVEDCGFRF